MALVPMESFEEGTEIVRVYLAASLAEALAAVRILSYAGLDYAVVVEEHVTRDLLGRGGEVLDAAADALERAGQLAGLVDRGRPG